MLVRMKRNGSVIWRRKLSVDRPGSLLAMLGCVKSAVWPKVDNWTLAHVSLLKYLEGIRCLPSVTLSLSSRPKLELTSIISDGRRQWR